MIFPMDHLAGKMRVYPEEVGFHGEIHQKINSITGKLECDFPLFEQNPPADQVSLTWAWLPLGVSEAVSEPSMFGASCCFFLALR